MLCRTLWSYRPPGVRWYIEGAGCATVRCSNRDNVSLVVVELCCYPVISLASGGSFSHSVYLISCEAGNCFSMSDVGGALQLCIVLSSPS